MVDVDCGAGAFCSERRTCVPTGSCFADDDCGSGLRCVLSSRRCVEPEATCSSTDECPGGEICEGGTCVIGGECGGTAYELELVAPNLMFVLDRSGTMDRATTSGGPKRWDALKTAVRSVLERYTGRINFGLTIYSSCIVGEPNSPGQILFPVGPGNEPRIHDWLDRALSCRSEETSLCVNLYSEAQCVDTHFAPADAVGEAFCVECTANPAETSTGPTLMTLVGLPALRESVSNQRGAVADGRKGDNDRRPLGARGGGDPVAQEPPVRTYVVGLADDIAPEALNATAEAGHTAGEASQTKYFQANDEVELEEAFDTIASRVSSCSYRVNAPPRKRTTSGSTFSSTVPDLQSRRTPPTVSPTTPRKASSPSTVRPVKHLGEARSNTSTWSTAVPKSFPPRLLTQDQVASLGPAWLTRTISTRCGFLLQRCLGQVSQSSATDAVACSATTVGSGASWGDSSTTSSGTKASCW